MLFVPFSLEWLARLRGGMPSMTRFGKDLILEHVSLCRGAWGIDFFGVTQFFRFLLQYVTVYRNPQMPELGRSETDGLYQKRRLGLPRKGASWKD